MAIDFRPVLMVLSPSSLPYAGTCLESLVRHATEPMDLALITDRPGDKSRLADVMGPIAEGSRHRWAVYDQADADARADDRFRGLEHVREFRRGHPCWRKVTDPPLFVEEGREMIILDPDVYFPAPFRFEPTPRAGLRLMWQRPNCLYPPEVVRRAFDRGVRMADHTDIGICQATNSLDWRWIDDLIGRLGGADLPARCPHVESIVWAALAMRVGGSYLDPRLWFCWQNTPWKRLRMQLLRANGLAIVAREDLRGLKCFHGGGRAKHWIPQMVAAGLFDAGPPPDLPAREIPFEEYRREQFDRKQLTRRLAARVGIGRIIGSPA
ncbi:hypothetical protein OJF2_10330 [Aquisphaera giovannonii]|uniref:Nucleotide-diphospho-sugar transferase n=1 Tax=Aquisphaera giovannonii TaxID=406548 RepID=A0A5B9VVS6_9BACT|nr:hypothetical protein [Aquisphaera giovannonii]QEH32556.1 hypothetical protein OJF2_10330 [Aquisphaera giovannonii]